MVDELTQRYYERHATEYASLTQGADLSPVWRLLECGLPAGSTVLDVGCGAGRDLRYFADAGYRPTGIDLSRRMAETARRFSGQPVIQGDLQRMPLPDDAFDAVWAIASFVHLGRGSVPSALLEVRRVLRPSGLFVASVKEGSGASVDEKGRRFMYFAVGGWSRSLREALFDVESIDVMSEPRGANGNIAEVKWIVSVCRGPGEEDRATC